jgi:hypothetical protein
MCTIEPTDNRQDDPTGSWVSTTQRSLQLHTMLPRSRLQSSWLGAAPHAAELQTTTPARASAAAINYVETKVLLELLFSCSCASLGKMGAAGRLSDLERMAAWDLIESQEYDLHARICARRSVQSPGMLFWVALTGSSLGYGAIVATWCYRPHVVACLHPETLLHVAAYIPTELRVSSAPIPRYLMHCSHQQHPDHRGPVVIQGMHRCIVGLVNQHWHMHGSTGGTPQPRATIRGILQHSSTAT